MQQVKLTDDALAAIQQGVSKLEAIDGEGRVCGYILSLEYHAKIAAWLTEFFHAPNAGEGPPTSEWYSTAEVLAYLRGVEAGFKRAK